MFEDDIVLYIGIGWVKNFVNSGFLFYVMFGVFFVGDVSVNLSVIGLIIFDLQFQVDLCVEECDINDDFEDFGVYLVFQFGILYCF